MRLEPAGLPSVLRVALLLGCSHLAASLRRSPKKETGAAADPSDLEIDVTPDLVFETSERFLSLTVDMGCLGDSRGLHWLRRPLVRALVRPLAPAYLRFGGTTADYTAYDPQSTGAALLARNDGWRASPEVSANPSDHPTLAAYHAGRNETTLSSGALVELFAFARDARLGLVFDANLGSYRTGSGSEAGAWDPTALRALLEQARRGGLGVLAGWELGNEPDLFPGKPARPRLGYNLTAEQLASDFAAFQGALRASGQAEALVIGPDVGTVHERDALFGGFLDLLGPGDARSPDVATWHFYYGPGTARRHALTRRNFSHPAVLDRFLHRAARARQQASAWLAAPPAAGRPARQLWVGETSSTYGGGSGSDSGSFLAGFMWLDKLGLAAGLGNAAVLRQTFVGNDYALLGPDDLPNPDYFSSVLWKRLVGTRVLNTSDALSPGRAFRAYAFCARGRDRGVALVALNTQERSVRMLPNLGGAREVYVLTARDPFGRDVFLNGAPAALRVDPATGALPPMSPSYVAEGVGVEFPPLSYGFVVLPGARMGTCTLRTASD